MTNCGLLMSGTIHTRVKVCKIDLLDDLGFSVKDKSSKLNLFSFFFLFIFLLIYSLFILFLELRVRVRVTRSRRHTSVTSDDMITSHKLHKRF